MVLLYLRKPRRTLRPHEKVRAASAPRVRRVRSARAPRVRRVRSAHAPRVRRVRSARAPRVRRVCAAFAPHVRRVCAAFAPRVRRVRSACAPRSLRVCAAFRHGRIMLVTLPIMLFPYAHKFSLLCFHFYPICPDYARVSQLFYAKSILYTVHVNASMLATGDSSI